jgi:5-methylcytosine-specific restriction endonuclease McrA
MFPQVRQAIERLRSLVADLDPSRLDGGHARRLVEEFAEVERLAAAGKALALRRVEETRAWADAGPFRDAAAWLAATGGTTVGHARATVETAARLEEFPETEAALRGGELSEVQVNEVVSAALADPSAERLLLDSAKRDGVRGLKDQCARVRAAACPDESARYQAIHEARSLRHWRDVDGTGRIDIRGPADATARVMATLRPYERDLFRSSRDAGRRERSDALAFDALVALTSSAGGERDGEPGCALVVRVDHTAFRRGRTESGEMCEVPGVGPIPVSVAHRLSDDAILKALIVDGEDVRAVAHLGRTIPAKLRTAVEEMFPECAVEGCHVNRHLEIDHNLPISEDGPTALWNLRRLCAHHHEYKHARNLRLEGQGTRQRFVPRGPPPEGPAPPARELALV